jgi:hypothetical protein
MSLRTFLSCFAIALVACGPSQPGDDGGPDGQSTETSTNDGSNDGEGGVTPPSIDKVDVLFAIDNSASMGDKQSLLSSAVATFINRLLVPNCVDVSAKTCKAPTDCSSLGSGALCDPYGNGGTGQCYIPGDGQACKSIPNTKPELSPVHDLHVGIVSSSLGGGGSPDVCVPATNDPTHQNDKGHLLNRTAGNPTEGTIANAKPTDGNGGNFLAWLPASDPKNAGKPAPNVTPYSDGQSAQLVTDFQSLVNGVNQHGCGLEAQLESWYRFLVQPDPWDSITLDTSNPPRAQLTSVDATLLKMRHDFLRPDSIVAIVQLTDEEDSWSDPMWLGGYGWVLRTQTTPGGPGQGVGPRGTSECDAAITSTTGPNNPDCVSCMFPQLTKPVAGTLIGQDPNCTSCVSGSCPQQGWYTPASQSVAIAAADGLNVRYSRQLMRRRFGVDNQFDYHRYVDGLSSTTVPDRTNEPHDSSVAYAPTRNCVNPLFAKNLPDGSDTTSATLCKLAVGPRTPDMVFYTIVGGVPNELVDDANGNVKLSLSASDWQAIVGQDPDHYIFTGIDPHMIQSTAPRAGLQAPGSSYSLGTDPVNGREWNTLTAAAAIDLEYACTFDLPTPKDCTAAANQNACDCVGTATTTADGPPLCSATTRTTQVKGKAYPQSRYQLVAKALGNQSIVASICAKVTTGNATAPAFGYNGAMAATIERMRPLLAP